MILGMVSFNAILDLNSHSNGGRLTPIFNMHETDVLIDGEIRMGKVRLSDEAELLHPGSKCQVLALILLHGTDDIDRVLNAEKISVVCGPANYGSLKILSVIDRHNVDWRQHKR